MEGGVWAKAEYICCCGDWLARWRAWAAAAASGGGGGGSRIRIRCYTDATGAQRQKALTRCCLLVLLVLDRTGGRMAGRTAVLWGPPLLGLARGGCRGLWVLWVWVQGGTRVWVLLRHWPWRHCSTERKQTKPIISWA